MLKVADLQQLIDGLTQPLRNAGASQKVLDDLARLGRGLEPFKERSLTEFNEFLEKADQCVRTGEWPEPGRRPSARRSSGAAAPSVAEAAQRLAGLLERAAAEPGLDVAAIEAELQPLEAMGGAQLKEAAEQVDLAARGRTKQDLLRGLATAIKERRTGGAERGAHAERPETGERRHGATEHAHQPVGATELGND